MEVIIVLLKAFLIAGLGILFIKKCFDYCIPRYDNPSLGIKCYSPGKCKDRYSSSCSICKYNRYTKKEKTYFKPRKNINGSS